jgi:hypothetical protein
MSLDCPPALQHQSNAHGQEKSVCAVHISIWHRNWEIRNFIRGIKASQLAAIPLPPRLRSGAGGAIQVAEKLDQDRFCNKGPTLVGPQTTDNKKWD